MRLIFSSFLIIIILFFSGCKSDESNDYIVLSTESVNYTHNGGSKEIIIECSASWTLYSDLPDWVTIDSKSGYSGKSIINISTSENTSDTARQCYLQFISGSESTLLKLTQSPIAKLEFAENKDISLNYTDTVITIKIIQNITYSIKLYSENNDWIEIENDKQSITSKSAKDYLNNNIKINISKNKTNFERSDKLIIYNKVYNLSDTLKIIQKGSIYDYYTDGDYVKLQEADKDGVNLVIMGEAFTIDELEKGGRYEHVMTQAMEYFFSIEPYKSYRKYFNVYMVIAESESSKIESGKTKFKIEFGSGTAISCDDKEIFEYASKIEELQENKPLTVIVPLKKRLITGESEVTTVAFRCPGDGWLRQIIKAVGKPIYSTSVNRSGQPVLSSVLEIDKEFGGEVKLIVDGGSTENALPSTLVKFEKGKCIILRQGDVCIPSSLLI